MVTPVEKYKPNKNEGYMNSSQLDFFRQKLLAWREELVVETQKALEEMLDSTAHQEIGDEADRATRESEHALEMRTRDRYRKLLPKIDAALQRIEDKTYGYCEETGEPIGLARLEARPIATLSVEAQERRELRQRQTGL